LQFFNKIQWYVFWNCIFSFFEGFIVNGVINVIIPALEKRYELSSSKSAVIASANDFGAVILYMFVGYFGEQRHKPKLMAVGILLMSLGSIIFAFPHYIGETYKYTISGLFEVIQNTCDNSILDYISEMDETAIYEMKDLCRTDIYKVVAGRKMYIEDYDFLRRVSHNKIIIDHC